jgi:hypothetical protein
MISEKPKSLFADELALKNSHFLSVVSRTSLKTQAQVCTV